jgi:RNA polymerase sigma-70 factor (ECF subfamily)
MKGAHEVGTYFGNYARTENWRCIPGMVDGQPAILVLDPRQSPEPVTYFVLLSWASERVQDIRDFRYARYVMESAEVTRV